MVRRKALYESYPTNEYKLRVSLESYVHITNFEHDSIEFKEAEKEGQLDCLEASFKAENIVEKRQRKKEIEEKFKTMVDSVALLKDKGMRLGTAMEMRAEKHVFPNGKELKFFRGWGPEETIIYSARARALLN